MNNYKENARKKFDDGIWHFRSGNKAMGIYYLNEAASEGDIKAMCKLVRIMLEDSFHPNDENLVVIKNQENLDKAIALLKMISIERNDAKDKTNIDEDCTEMVKVADELIFSLEDNRWLVEAPISFEILSYFAINYVGPLQVTAEASLTRWKKSGGGPNWKNNCDPDGDFSIDKVKNPLLEGSSNSKIYR